ncbi:hypothetical protein HYPSUDRAFT_651096 [Hypholoma sublateritium FD-334 SS-4]|uniref:Uncharacterized protein n=1 Tax=Hypholoma sublateritium (strain FD-334 SS-4) TaxID=945553 RepID=A0A0D2PRP4_HYPSF|nr:hypothetical protein HYPSUDRAFT_651096 [Hypholoma sublateritium FD-334 SS-4]
MRIPSPHWIVHLKLILFALALLAPRHTAAGPLSALRVPHVVAAKRLFAPGAGPYLNQNSGPSAYAACTDPECAWGRATGDSEGKGDLREGWRDARRAAEALMGDIAAWA